MIYGFHISISGGLSKVTERAVRRGCGTIQIFSRNPRGWRYTALDPVEVETFKAQMRESAITPVVVHMPYLPNPASPDDELHRKSIDSLIEELRRADLLDSPFVVVHVGKHMGSTIDEALRRVASAVNAALAEVRNDVLLLLEGTAGQGSEVGCEFSQIRDVIAQVDEPHRVGVCLDTAHMFEAGYDVSTREGLDKTLAEFDDLVGLDKLHLLHLNDSATPLGSHKDRHWHIGKGEIGLEGFRIIVNHPKLKGLPGIMETPPGEEEDITNMQVIRSL
ncbi:MAG TPA: deoxyribonuclease IV [Candidatus Latescibacteria bacterium]|nr:deoxyribonuclease IV [Candidatus Latescibacterota bacterium]